MVYIAIKRAAPHGLSQEREAAAAALHELISKHAPELVPYTVAHTNAGRPYIAGGENTDISISHTDGYAACALITGEGKRVGVDIEKVKRSRPGVAKKYFTPEEQNLLFSLDEKDAAVLFTKLWTKYEARSKYLGGGLADMRKKSDAYIDCFTFGGEDEGEFVVSVCTKKKEETNVVFLP